MQYVDDMVLAGKSDAQLAEVKEAICQCFEVEDLGELHYFLGEKIIQNQENMESGWVKLHTLKNYWRNLE